MRNRPASLRTLALGPLLTLGLLAGTSPFGSCAQAANSRPAVAVNNAREGEGQMRMGLQAPGAEKTSGHSPPKPPQSLRLRRAALHGNVGGRAR